MHCHKISAYGDKKLLFSARNVVAGLNFSANFERGFLFGVLLSQLRDHANIIKYCDRPFTTVDEMDAEIIRRHNEIVGSKGVVIHAGDFTLSKKPFAENYIRRLNGTHFFLKGSHDYWLKKSATVIWERDIEGFYVVVCHFAMRVWPRSHYNSWQLYGHSHGKLPPIGKQWDIGVDNNDFYPVSFSKIREIMQNSPDNPNYVGNRAF